MMSTICNAKDVPMHVIKAYSGVEIYLHSFLSSLLGGSEKSVSLTRKKFQCLSNRRLCGPQSHSIFLGEERNCLLLLRI